MEWESHSSTLPHHCPRGVRSPGRGFACSHPSEEGGCPPPPPGPPFPRTKVTIAGKHKIYKWEILVGPFLVHKLAGPIPPFPPGPPSNTFLPSPLPSPLRQQR